MKASKANQSTNKESVLSRTEERGKGRQGGESFSPQKSTFREDIGKFSLNFIINSIDNNKK